jgi:hypothetical protein
MKPLTASFLLTKPDVVLPVAPWCTWLDNLELAVLLLAQPWMSTGGLRRSELERSLAELSQDFPVGQTYFQRINRTTAALEKRGQLQADASTHGRRFATSVEGFAALVLNLQVLRLDPTLDGTEFELKRAIITLNNRVFRAVESSAGGPPESPDLDSFFRRIDDLYILGRPVITNQSLANAFDVRRLIDRQRHRVVNMMLAQEQRLARLEETERLLDDLDAVERQTAPAEHLVHLARTAAAGAVPAVCAASAAARYRSYLDYLDDLEKISSPSRFPPLALNDIGMES